MGCFHPLSAYRDEDGGAPRIGRRPAEEGRFLELPCGRCIGCRQSRARAWSLRIMHEAMCWDASRFVTLSYAPESLRSWSLEYVDFQRFMKRLRKELSGVSEGSDGKRPIRFFCAGEYGKLYRRPHFHAILFNCRFADEVELYNGDRRSEMLNRLWSHGECHVGEVTPQSAAYVASYTVEKEYGLGREAGYEDVCDAETGEVLERRPEFATMSRRPGIGAEWFRRYGRDALPRDYAVDSDGRRWPVPRYYLERFKESASSYQVSVIVEERERRALDYPREERSVERREVREAVRWARAKQFAREH